MARRESYGALSVEVLQREIQALEETLRQDFGTVVEIEELILMRSAYSKMGGDTQVETNKIERELGVKLGIAVEWILSNQRGRSLSNVITTYAIENNLDQARLVNAVADSLEFDQIRRWDILEEVNYLMREYRLMDPTQENAFDDWNTEGVNKGYDRYLSEKPMTERGAEYLLRDLVLMGKGRLSDDLESKRMALITHLRNERFTELRQDQKVMLRKIERVAETGWEPEPAPLKTVQEWIEENRQGLLGRIEDSRVFVYEQYYRNIATQDGVEDLKSKINEFEVKLYEDLGRFMNETELRESGVLNTVRDLGIHMNAIEKVIKEYSLESKDEEGVAFDSGVDNISETRTLGTHEEYMANRGIGASQAEVENFIRYRTMEGGWEDATVVERAHKEKLRRQQVFLNIEDAFASVLGRLEDGELTADSARERLVKHLARVRVGNEGIDFSAFENKISKIFGPVVEEAEAGIVSGADATAIVENTERSAGLFAKVIENLKASKLGTAGLEIVKMVVENRTAITGGELNIFQEAAARGMTVPELMREREVLELETKIEASEQFKMMVANDISPEVAMEVCKEMGVGQVSTAENNNETGGVEVVEEARVYSLQEVQADPQLLKGLIEGSEWYNEMVDGGLDANYARGFIAREIRNYPSGARALKVLSGKPVDDTGARVEKIEYKEAA